MQQLLIKSEVPDDPRTCRISGSNAVVAVDESMWLMEVGGLGHVGGDLCVIVAERGDETQFIERVRSAGMPSFLQYTFAVHAPKRWIPSCPSLIRKARSKWLARRDHGSANS
jgi:hypothetical protein